MGMSAVTAVPTQEAVAIAMSSTVQMHPAASLGGAQRI